MIVKKLDSPVAVNRLIKFESKPTIEYLLNISNKLISGHSSEYVKYDFKNIEIIEHDNNWYISIIE